MALPKLNLEERADVVSSLFIGYFNRAAEYEAVTYYVQRYLDYLAELPESNDAESIAANLLSAEIYYTGATYDEIPFQQQQSDEAFVALLYENMLGRPAADDPVGAQYWLNQLATGSLSREDILPSFATAATLSEDDHAYMENRLAIAREFAKEENSAPDILSDLAHDAAAVLKGVTADPATRESALEKLKSYADDADDGRTDDDINNDPPDNDNDDNQEPGDDGNDQGGDNDDDDGSNDDDPGNNDDDDSGGNGDDQGGDDDDDDTSTDLFTVVVNEGVVSFGGSATGEITLSLDGENNLSFTRDGFTAQVSISVSDGAPTVALAAGDALVVPSAMLPHLPGFNVTGGSGATLFFQDAISVSQLLQVANHFTGIMVYNLTGSLSTALEHVALFEGAQSYGLHDAVLELTDVTLANVPIEAAKAQYVISQATNGDDLALQLSYTIADDLDNIAVALLDDPAEAGAVFDQATSYTLTSASYHMNDLSVDDIARFLGRLEGDLPTAAQIQALAAGLIAGASNASELTLDVSFTLADTLANVLVWNDSPLRTEALLYARQVSYALTDDPSSLTVVDAAEAEVIGDASNASSFTFSVVDTVNNLVGVANLSNAQAITAVIGEDDYIRLSDFDLDVDINTLQLNAGSFVWLTATEANSLSAISGTQHGAETLVLDGPGHYHLGLVLNDIDAVLLDMSDLANSVVVEDGQSPSSEEGFNLVADSVLHFLLDNDIEPFNHVGELVDFLGSYEGEGLVGPDLAAGETAFILVSGGDITQIYHYDAMDGVAGITAFEVQLIGSVNGAEIDVVTSWL